MSRHYFLAFIWFALLAAPAVSYAEEEKKKSPSITETATPATYIQLAGEYRRGGQAKEAIAIMSEAEARFPTDEKVLAHLGYALIAGKEYRQAVDVYDKLTAIHHDSVAGYNGKAVAFDHAGNHVAAQEIYQKALSLSPTSATVQNNLALSLILDNKPGMAISILEPLAKQPGARPAVRHNLALAYGVKGDMKRAHQINAQDLPPEQADENQFFYEQYAHMLKKQQLEALSPRMDAALPDAMTMEDAPEPVELKPAAGTPALQEKPSEGKFWGYDATYSYPGK